MRLGKLKSLVIIPKVNPIPLHELIRMAGAKAKMIEGKPDKFFDILSYWYAPEYHAYVVLYAEGRLLSKDSVLERGCVT